MNTMRLSVLGLVFLFSSVPVFAADKAPDLMKSCIKECPDAKTKEAVHECIEAKLKGAEATAFKKTTCYKDHEHAEKEHHDNHKH